MLQTIYQSLILNLPLKSCNLFLLYYYWELTKFDSR